MLWVWIAVVWLVVGLGVTLLVAWSIRLADRRAAQAREMPNFVADLTYLPAPRPTGEHHPADDPTHHRQSG